MCKEQIEAINERCRRRQARHQALPLSGYEPRSLKPTAARIQYYPSTIANNNQTTKRHERHLRRQQRIDEFHYIQQLLHHCRLNSLEQSQQEPTPATSPGMSETDAPKLPKLSYNNFHFWQAALRINAALHEAEDILSYPNPTPLQDPAAAITFNKKTNKLKALIIQSLPDDIVTKMPQNFLDASPHDICNSLKTHISTNNMQNHDVLEAEARSALFLPGTDIDEYVVQHENIRRKMINASYPLIDDEKTTVKFMVQGLRKHPDFHNLAIIFTGNLPPNIRAFANHIRQALLLQEDGPNLPPTPSRLPHFTPQFPQVTRYSRRIPPIDRKCPKPTDWQGKWCTFHASPTHDNSDCRELNRLRRPRQNAPYQVKQVQGDPTNTPHFEELALRVASLENAFHTPQEHEEGKSYTLDSAANPSYTATSQRSLKKFSQPLYTFTANGNRHCITHGGQITIPTTNRNPLKLSNAFHSPSIPCNLLSVHDLAKSYGKVSFFPAVAFIHNKTNVNKISAAAKYHNGRYQLLTRSKGTMAHYAPKPPFRVHGIRTLPSKRTAAKKINTIISSPSSTNHKSIPQKTQPRYMPAAITSSKSAISALHQLPSLPTTHNRPLTSTQKILSRLASPTRPHSTQNHGTHGKTQTTPSTAQFPFQCPPKYHLQRMSYRETTARQPPPSLPLGKQSVANLIRCLRSSQPTLPNPSLSLCPNVPRHCIALPLHRTIEKQERSTLQHYEFYREDPEYHRTLP